jgi:hypothetical protein
MNPAGPLTWRGGEQVKRMAQILKRSGSGMSDEPDIEKARAEFKTRKKLRSDSTLFSIDQSMP